MIFPLILWLFGRISSGEKAQRTEILEKKVKILKKWGAGKNKKNCRELYTPPISLLAAESLYEQENGGSHLSSLLIITVVFAYIFVFACYYCRLCLLAAEPLYEQENGGSHLEQDRQRQHRDQGRTRQRQHFKSNV